MDDKSLAEEKKTKSLKLKRFLQKLPASAVVVLFVVVILGPTVGKYALGLVGFNYIYSDGVRVGQVVKMSEKGIFWKTQELGMGLTQSGAYVEYWDFSIDNKNSNKENLVTTLTQAYQTGQLVAVTYTQRYGALPWRAGTSYLVEKVEFVR